MAPTQPSPSPSDHDGYLPDDIDHAAPNATNRTVPPADNADAAADAEAEIEADYSLIMSYPSDSEPDYYALLGLRRTPAPTDAEIRSAYRTLTLSFHPDKQPAAWQEAAAKQFARIREAYETLIDPRKRTVYDLLGAEGVRREWGMGGAMGRSGEAEREEWKVGVRAQSPEEFRRWFIETMKRRERRVVNGLVASRGSLTLGVNASSLMSFDPEEGETHLHIPSVKLSNYRIGYSFKAPVPTLRKLLGEDEKEEPEEEQDEKDPAKIAAQEAEHDEELQMTINASVGGPLKRLRQGVTVEMEDGTQEQRKVPLPPIVVSDRIQLGAGMSKAFGDVSARKGIFNWRPFSFLSYSAVSVNANVLATPSVQTNFVKALTLVPGTKPIMVNVSTAFHRSLVKAPPTFGLQLSKQIGERKHAVCNWSSGTIGWPDGVIEFFSPLLDMGIDLDSAFSTPTELSQLSFAIMSTPQSPKNAASMGTDDDDDDTEGAEDEEEDDEFKQLRSKQRAENKANESWQVGAVASPQGSALTFTYARNIFSGTPANDPARSEWSSEGHYPLPPANETRSVRVEVRSTLSLNMALGWAVEGSRQVGELTRMGVGVGVEGASGIVMTVSWNRLGQRIRLPIVVCPIDAVSADAAALALLFPWVAYCALEFGFIRPRERKNRRRVVARRQKELKKLVPKKRAESQQAIELMKDQVLRRQAKEERQGGLVITKAEYVPQPVKKGRKKSSARVEGYEAADVTIPVAALVDRGQLVIPAKTAKFHIIGIHDPAPLLPKTLKIWYTYHGKEHYVEAEDAAGIACPMRSHLL